MQPKTWGLITVVAIVIALGVYPFVQGDSGKGHMGDAAGVSVSSPVVSPELDQPSNDPDSGRHIDSKIEIEPIKEDITDAATEKKPNHESQLSDAEFDEKVDALQNRNDDDLEVIHHADGSVSANISDRYRNVPTARIDKDGNVKVEQ